MKRKCTFLMFAAMFLATCGNIHGKSDNNWKAIADSSSKSLISNFWNTKYYYFNEHSDSTKWGGNYWPQAHALDVLVDAYGRSGDDFYRGYFELWLEGVHRANGNRWVNNYIDDMEWIGLATLRAYQATGIKGFLTACKEVWDGVTDDMEDRNAAFGIKRAWTDAGGGGVFWESRRNRHSKNACSNGPAAILAAHLYQAFGDKEDLDWAKKIYAWEKQYLFNPETGAVYDNLNTTTGVTNTRMVFTYNTGTFLGAAVELYKITGDKTYINDAMKAADYTITTLINANDNLLKSEGRRDGGLFKGIFVRYFTQLILSDGISDDVRSRYIAFLKHNGETLWREGTDKKKVLFSPYWKTAPDGSTGHTEHLSGCMLMEALALLQKEGKLESRQAVVPFDSPDPTAIMTPDGKGLYVFTTGRGIQILYSSNFMDWERADRVFSKDRFPADMPDWAQQAIPNARGLWAPDIVFHNNRYYVYYAVSTVGSRRSAIGLATNKTLDRTSPDYMWKDEGMVLESHPDHTDYNAIDPALFIDKNGKAYLFWGSYWTGLKAVEVDSKTGKPFRYVSGNLKIPAGYVPVASRPDHSIEAPYVIRRGNWYYLFVSWGTTLDGVGSTYRIAVGRSKQPLGPYMDRDGRQMNQGGGTTVFSGTEKWKGTGHNGIFQTTKEGKNRGDWLIFHAIDKELPKSGRLTQIRPLYWDEAGWPVAGEILNVPFEDFDFSVWKKN